MEEMMMDIPGESTEREGIVVELRGSSQSDLWLL